MARLPSHKILHLQRLESLINDGTALTGLNWSTHAYCLVHLFLLLADVQKESLHRRDPDYRDSDGKLDHLKFTVKTGYYWKDVLRRLAFVARLWIGNIFSGSSHHRKLGCVGLVGLKMRKLSKNPQIQNSNKPREWIRHFFPKRKCFVFDRPTNDKKLLLHVEEVPEDQLDSNFQVQSENFCSYILTHAKTKTLREGILVTGNRLGMLVETYLDAINSGAVPCLENAMAALAQHENSAAVQRAADHYSQRMAQQVRFPTDTLQDLLDVHTACEREAIAVFMEHSFKDKNQEFQKKLVDTMEKKKEDFVLQNEEASAKYCQAELKRLSELLMESISRGTFFVPGGHDIYLEAKRKIEQDYTLVPRKGIKANEVLQSFLQSQVIIEESILQSDKALTAGEKAIAAKQAEKEAAEKEQELLRQKQKEQQQMMKAQERSFQENIAQLKKKMERERENYMKDLRKMLSHKLKVLEEPLTEGFKEIFESLNEEIDRLKEEIEAAENEEPLMFSQILGTDKKSKSFNDPRLCIRKFFPNRKCFIFDWPVQKKYLARLEQLKEEELNPDFIEQVAEFCSYILSHSNVKTLSGGIPVNGPRLESLVLTYVNAISSAYLPCMENTVLALAQIENSAAVEKAIAHYEQQMGQKVQLPTETLQELLDLHRDSEREAIEVFMKNSFKDVDQTFQRKLGKQQELKNKYYQVPRKGIQAEEVLKKYLESKEDVADALLQTDQSLSEKEKAIEVERIKAESAEAAKKMLEEIQKKNEQMMEQKDKSYQEHVKQLTEKMERDRAQLMAEQEKTLALKLQVFRIRSDNRLEEEPSRDSSQFELPTGLLKATRSGLCMGYTGSR
ncbi:hypothetical protein H8959_006103 [Pygathrix nigripes]